nr:halocidin precursor [Halocynthia aurantium]
MNTKVIFAIALIAMLSVPTEAWLNALLHHGLNCAKGVLAGDAETMAALRTLKAQDQASYMKLMDGLEKVDEIKLGSKQAAENIAQLDAMVDEVMMQ